MKHILPLIISFIMVRHTYTRTYSIDSTGYPQLKHVQNVRHHLTPNSPGTHGILHLSLQIYSSTFFIFTIQHKHLHTRDKSHLISSTLDTSIKILPDKLYLSPIFSPSLLLPLQFRPSLQLSDSFNSFLIIS